MKKIIVTVIVPGKDNCNQLNYDMELPTNLELSKLVDDLVQTLQGANPELRFDISRVRLFDTRLNASLLPADTLEKAGVWNGDIIILNTF